MEAKKFDKLCKELLDKSTSTLFDKSHEYATDEDRLANFRQPTTMTGMSTAEVCLMYQMKHIASVTKIAKESSKGILPSKELLQEKCQDMVNYTLIFYTAMMEMIEAEKPAEPAKPKAKRGRKPKKQQPAEEALTVDTSADGLFEDTSDINTYGFIETEA